MQETTITNNDLITMKLLHYFITEEKYNPIVLHGAKNEIWLENLEKDYKVVRIVSNYIHNNEQFDFDIFKTKKVVEKIKKKTLTININVLNIFINLGDNVNIPEIPNMASINLKDDDLNSRDSLLTKLFPNMAKKMDYKEDGIELFSKITKDINKRNEQVNKETSDVFTEKTPYVTYLIIGINIAVFLMMSFLGNGSTNVSTLVDFGALIKNGQIYRVFTSMFLHIGIIHLLINSYSLHIIGPQIENFFGRTKFLIIYLFGGICGGLLSYAFMTTNSLSAGASGAIFGLLGSLLYFGYHYRLYLGNTLKGQIIPLIILNLAIGFTFEGIDNAGHIGGLIGGILSSIAVGVKHKSTKTDKINGWIMSLIFIGFLIYYNFFR